MNVKANIFLIIVNKVGKCMNILIAIVRYTNWLLLVSFPEQD